MYFGEHVKASISVLIVEQIFPTVFRDFTVGLHLEDCCFDHFLMGTGEIRRDLPVVIRVG